MKKLRPSSRESTAFHEAAHAIVGHLLGWCIDGISIVAANSFNGYTLTRRMQRVPGVIKKGEPPDDDGPLAERLTLKYAGIVAERLLCTRRGVSSKPVRLGRDIREARYYVRNLPKEEQSELLNSAEKHAVKLLSIPQNWQILEEIAVELLEFETLNCLSLLTLLPTI